MLYYFAELFNYHIFNTIFIFTFSFKEVTLISLGLTNINLKFRFVGWAFGWWGLRFFFKNKYLKIKIFFLNS